MLTPLIVRHVPKDAGTIRVGLLPFLHILRTVIYKDVRFDAVLSGTVDNVFASDLKVVVEPLFSFHHPVQGRAEGRGNNEHASQRG